MPPRSPPPATPITALTIALRGREPTLSLGESARAILRLRGEASPHVTQMFSSIVETWMSPELGTVPKEELMEKLEKDVIGQLEQRRSRRIMHEKIKKMRREEEAKEAAIEEYNRKVIVGAKRMANRQVRDEALLRSDIVRARAIGPARSLVE